MSPNIMSREAVSTRLLVFLLSLIIAPNAVALQARMTVDRDTAQAAVPRRGRPGAQFRIPLGSLIVPGLGQYLNGAIIPGVAFTSVAGAGIGVGLGVSSNSLDDLPRTADDQLAFEAFQAAFTSGALSAWDAFHRGIPSLQQEGKYRFLPAERPSLGSLFTAPFDMRFLGRWTTWIDLGYAGLITALVLGSRDTDVTYEPFERRDGIFVSAVSFNAAVGEEALFRGWLLPLFHQSTGENFWLANTLQGSIFGLAHLGQAKAFALAIAGWSIYQGWLVRRNDWGIRESIFHHFWYDIFVATATLLADERNSVQIRFATLRF